MSRVHGKSVDAGFSIVIGSCCAIFGMCSGAETRVRSRLIKLRAPPDDKSDVRDYCCTSNSGSNGRAALLYGLASSSPSEILQVEN